MESTTAEAEPTAQEPEDAPAPLIMVESADEGGVCAADGTCD
ncbi:hypothetical protein [Paractinoplanes toevensis]|nr:hypothetical protein [Actinoplanes toevensis]